VAEYVTERRQRLENMVKHKLVITADPRSRGRSTGFLLSRGTAPFFQKSCSFLTKGIYFLYADVSLCGDDAKGESARGSVEVADKHALTEWLKQQQLFLVSCHEDGQETSQAPLELTNVPWPEVPLPMQEESAPATALPLARSYAFPKCSFWW